VVLVHRLNHCVSLYKGVFFFFFFLFFFFGFGFLLSLFFLLFFFGSYGTGIYKGCVASRGDALWSFILFKPPQSLMQNQDLKPLLKRLVLHTFLNHPCKHVRAGIGLKQGWHNPSSLDEQGEQAFLVIKIKLKRKHNAQTLPPHKLFMSILRRRQ
jgi:hypothetical protein